ncbi:MAG: aminotransferase class I/II-fold pyridoxal phosphate-dependent enzyme [Clostridiaceae bacterium]|nr:aminotransferase class I/II-fold pyridoxal phosphate-dependent enzyme [Clostridiaceae bacterium]
MEPVNNTPIYKMLKEYYEKGFLPFHMPGHILGRGLCEELKLAGSLDITEVPGSDCLHEPRGVIKEAQERAALCFGADYSLFLVNGSTSGIHAMIQAAVKPGGKLILGRDCHISALNALAQINGKPVFVLPDVDEKHQIPLGVTADSLEIVLKENPDAQAVLITRPGYYGTATQLRNISKLAKAYNMPLLVDEAHGAHFRFHEDLPEPAITQGADLCVQSLHKTLPTLTQTAILHGNSKSLIDRRIIERTVSMVQTTSPSYLLMASIDIARSIMENKGRELYEKLKHNISDFLIKLDKNTCIKRIKCDNENFEIDFSRIVLSFKSLGISGFEVEEILRSRFGIVAEMADLNHIVLIATPFHNSMDFDKLLMALKLISDEYRTVKAKAKLPRWPQQLPERIVPLREALFENVEEIPFINALDRVSGVFITPYPPGIPLVAPGEIINKEVIDYVDILLRENCPVHGIHDQKIKVLKARL